jgi:hypothetical protein
MNQPWRGWHCWPISLLLAPVVSFANGAPIARSFFEQTGNIVAVREPGIDLQQETLQIVIDGDWVTVHAEYLLHNSKQAATVAYGFPVDFTNPDWCSDCDDVNEEEKSRLGPPLRDVRIEANGKQLVTREITEPIGSDTPPRFIRTWIISDLPFSAAEHSTVTVSYRVRSELYDSVWSTNFAPSYSNRTFRYVLNPSGHWGDGQVERLDISIDIAKLVQFGGKLGTVAPAGHSREGDQLRWQLSNVDLRKLPDLQLEYDESARLLSEFIARERLPSAAITGARASSTLQDPTETGRHDISKVLDGDPGTAWCEGAAGDGAGQTLTFNFRAGVTVDGVGVLNGYTKSAGVYSGNGRAARMTAAITRARADPSQISASLPNRDFRQLHRQAWAPFIDWIVDAPYSGEMGEITLTLDAATSGGKHADTCISEVYFIGHAEP